MKHLSLKTIMKVTFLVLVWGISWSVYKIALHYTPPLLFAGMRSLAGGLLLAVILLPQWKYLRFKENWRFYFISAILNTAMFFGFQTVGLIYLPQGLFSVIVYLQPILIGFFAWLWLGEPLTKLKVIGLIIGFLGVFVISIEGLTGTISLLGIALAIASAVSWGLGVIYVKAISAKVHSLWLVAQQCIFGGVILTIIGLFTESLGDIVWNGHYIFGLLYGSILGIPAAFAIYYDLVNNGNASTVGSLTFLVPLIAVAIGIVFLNEPLTVYFVSGLLLIVLSIYLVNRRSRQPEQRIRKKSA